MGSAGIIVTMMRSFAVIATVASIAALSSASTLTEMYVKMADCSDCGMGSLGALSVKVCGQAPVSSPGGQCCVAVNLDNSENNFQDGGAQCLLHRSSARHLQGRRIGRVPEL